MSHRKGFTLIELLIVIAILGILAAAVIVVLNPAELLAQARDGTRVSDLDSIRSAVSLYATDVSPVSFSSTSPFAINNAACAFTTCTVRGVYTVEGSGWAAINLAAITGGSPLSTLPRDPTNSATYQYAYKGDNTFKTFELDAKLESTKYSVRMTTDGGSDATYYEVGNDPGLDL